MTKNNKKSAKEQLEYLLEENMLLRDQLNVIIKSLVNSDMILKKLIVEHDQMYTDMSAISTILQSLCNVQEISNDKNSYDYYYNSTLSQSSGSFDNNLN